MYTDTINAVDGPNESAFKRNDSDAKRSAEKQHRRRSRGLSGGIYGGSSGGGPVRRVGLIKTASGFDGDLGTGCRKWRKIVYRVICDPHATCSK